METNTSKPLIKCRKRRDVIKTVGGVVNPGQVWRKPAYCPDGDRYGGGVNMAQALVRNLGTCSSMLRETSKQKTCKDKSTEAKSRGGTACISDEAAVMAVE